MAVENVSFEVEKGSTVLLLGPNGAGKTTIIKCVMGLINFEGIIQVDGLDAGTQGKAVRSRIGYLPQNLSFYETLTIAQQAEFLASLKGVGNGAIREKLETVNLWQFKDRRVRSLSSGMRQRLAIAFALLSDPPLLIFDEPVSNVDLRGQLEFQTLLEQFSKQGKTSLITTHILGLDKYAQMAVVMDQGKVIARGPPDVLLEEIEARDTVYLKVANRDIERATTTLNGGGATSVKTKGEWLIFSAAPAVKAELIRSLVEAGIRINDVIIEPATIEAQYIKFLREKQA